MRPGQFNKNRNRNRNRNNHRSGGNSNTGGGNPANRVYDSNGPDVKVRGTAQTIAEKYMQLGRDAQSAGDIVMAESYYQHSEHYYRLWLANQPAGQPIQFLRRGNEEEYEDESGADGPDGEDDGGESQMPTEQAALPAAEEGAEQAVAQDGGQPNAPRNFRQREFRDNREQRDGGEGQQPRGERFRSRWGRRDRNGNEVPRENLNRNRDLPADGPERPAEPAVDRVPEAETGNWEAPSFLTRPVPAVPAEVVGEPEVAVASERRPRTRRPRAETPEPSPEEAAE